MNVHGREPGPPGWTHGHAGGPGGLQGASQTEEHLVLEDVLPGLREDRGHCSSWTRAAHAEGVHTHPRAREHVSAQAALPWEKWVPPVPAQGTAPPQKAPCPLKLPQTGRGGGPPAPRISTVPDPWVPEPAPTPGSQVGENTGWTLGRGCGVPLSAINSLEFTLALYIITRLFTAF